MTTATTAARDVGMLLACFADPQASAAPLLAAICSDSHRAGAALTVLCAMVSALATATEQTAGLPAGEALEAFLARMEADG